jgi:hypothetical protein
MRLGEIGYDDFVNAAGCSRARLASASVRLDKLAKNGASRLHGVL